MTRSGRWFPLLVALVLVVGPGAGRAEAAVEIQWWHAMDGALEAWVNDLADGFNKSQQEYHVDAIYKGNYTETMTAAIAAFRAKQHPQIVQVFEVGTATMMAAKGAIKPVYELMAQAGEKFDPKAYLPAVPGYYTTADGRMLSLPLNSSTPVSTTTRTPSRRRGSIRPSRPRPGPRWASTGRRSRPPGYPCGFSSQWQQWILLENFSAWHNLPFATQAERLRRPRHGPPAQHPAPRPPHRSTRPVAEDEDSSTMAGVRATASQSSRQRNAGCSSLRRPPTRRREGGEGQVRVRDHHDAVLARRQGRAAELDHRGRHAVGPRRTPAGAVQGRGEVLHVPLLARGSGRVASADRIPADHDGRIRADQEAGVLRQEPGHGHLDPPDEQQAADRQLEGTPARQLSQIRDVLDEELEAVWAGTKTAKEALDAAVRAGNELLRQFERTNR